MVSQFHKENSFTPETKEIFTPRKQGFADPCNVVLTIRAFLSSLYMCIFPELTAFTTRKVLSSEV